jgi:hypothetical protein
MASSGSSRKRSYLSSADPALRKDQGYLDPGRRADGARPHLRIVHPRDVLRVLVRVNIVTCQLHRCIAPAQGYTQSDHRPSVKLVISTDRTDRKSQIENDRAAKQLIPMRSIRGRYLSWRSIPYRPRAIAGQTTARKKILQNGTLRTVRSMRSVLCDAY